MRHINPTPEMWRQPRPAYDYFNAPERDGWNPRWLEPGDPSGHDGCDCYSRKATPAVATESGLIHWAGRKATNWGAGKFVEIHHPSIQVTDELSRYLHLSEVLVKKGERVEQGQVIGEVGCTGQCKMAHVHYGLMRLDGGYHPSSTGLAHIRRRDAVWLDPIAEGILVNKPELPGEPPEPPSDCWCQDLPTLRLFDGWKANVELQPHVRNMQSGLANHGRKAANTFNRQCEADGQFGNGTLAELEAFNDANGIVNRSECGPETWRKLNHL